MNISDLYRDLDDNDKWEIERIGEKIQSGKAILFMGAAVHCPPPKGFEELYAEASRPPMGRELAETLKAALPPQAQKSQSLSWISQFYEMRYSRPELIERLAQALSNKSPSLVVHALAQMNFKYVITTNYDNLFEQALQAIGKDPYKNKGIYKPNKTNPEPELTADFSMNDISFQTPFIYKIHGDIEEVYKNEDAPNEQIYTPKKDAIVLTDEDYIHFILRMGERDNLDPGKNINPVPASFTKVLAKPDDTTIVFIGYGLMDYNLRLLFKSALWKKDKRSQLRKWSVDRWPDDTIQSIFENYNITFIEKDIWAVVAYLYHSIFKHDIGQPA